MGIGEKWVKRWGKVKYLEFRVENWVKTKFKERFKGSVNETR